jgi:hypothetical protein
MLLPVLKGARSVSNPAKSSRPPAQRTKAGPRSGRRGKARSVASRYASSSSPATRRRPPRFKPTGLAKTRTATGR